MSKLYIIIICILITVYGFQCGEDCETSIYDTTSINVSISPENFTYNIGDTIKIRTSPQSQFLLNDSQVFKDHSNNRIFLYFDLFEIKSDNNPIDSPAIGIEINHNGLNLKNNSPSNSISITKFIEWTCEENECPLVMNYILTKEGYFGMRLLHGFLSENSDCEEYELRNNMFDIQGNNFENLIEINTDQIVFDEGISDFSGLVSFNGDFYFKVE